MTISDAIPIQFWLNGVESYNQKEVCGINPACFCQPFNADDEIRIQFQDSDSNKYELIILDDSGNEITVFDFTEIADDTWEVSFRFEDYSIVSENVRLRIDSYPLSIENSAQSDGYTQTALGGSNPDWSLTNDPPSVRVISAGAGVIVSENMYKAIIPFVIGDTIDLHSVVSTGASPNISQILVDVVYMSVSFSVLSSEFIFVGNVSSTQTEDNALTIPAGTVYIGFRATVSFTGVGDVTITLDTIEFEAFQLANSDCISIRESHDCTQLIRYVNSKNFADINYTSLSPTAEFYLRIPAIFFHETNPTEEEDFETSGQTTVSLRQEVKVKRRLEIGYMPDYMHRKMTLVLAHQTIEIDGDEWVRRDPYEKVPPAQKRYPLKMANVLLTLQGYIKRNIL